MTPKPKALAVAIYCRVSTADKGQNPEVQAAELRRYCDARGWSIIEEVVDHGFSGGTDQRPGLKRLMALVRARKVEVVLVVKMDRLFRSLKHLVTTLDEFTALGVQFVSLGDQIDLTTAGGRLMLHLLGAFAEFEKSLARDRTMAGLAYARSQGKKLGRPITRPDDTILQLRREGASYTAIQRKLGVSRPAIRRALIAAGSTKTSSIHQAKDVSNRGVSHG